MVPDGNPPRRCRKELDQRYCTRAIGNRSAYRPAIRPLGFSPGQSQKPMTMSGSQSKRAVRLSRKCDSASRRPPPHRGRTGRTAPDAAVHKRPAVIGASSAASKEGAFENSAKTPGPAPRRAIFLEHDPEKWAPVFGTDHAPAKEHDPEKACSELGLGWAPVFGKDRAAENVRDARSFNLKRSCAKPRGRSRYPRRRRRCGSESATPPGSGA